MPWVGGEMPDAFVRVLADFAGRGQGSIGRHGNSLPSETIPQTAELFPLPITLPTPLGHCPAVIGIVRTGDLLSDNQRTRCEPGKLTENDAVLRPG